MATSHKFGREHEGSFELSKTEALELITLLTGQLANKAVPGNMAGACPTITLYEEVEGGKVISKFTFLLKP